MLQFLMWLINLLFQVASLLVIAHVILSYFMNPYHPVREAIDRLVNPMLAPIRRILPSVGMLDFSPIVLLILLQVLNRLLINIIIAIAL